MLRFKQWLRRNRAPMLSAVIVSDDLSAFRMLEEGKWYNGRFEKSLRVDNATHGVGQRHAHLFGRKGEEIGIINVDGTGSHGWTNVRVPDDDAEKLRQLGFTIAPDNIVEWQILSDAPQLLLS